MGKPRKLRSSMKAIHDALSSFRLAVGTPLCVQPGKTESFRDLISSFNSVYYTPQISTSSSSCCASEPCSHGSLCYHLQHYPVDSRRSSHGEGYEAEVEEEAVSNSAASASTRTCSSCLSSASVAAGHDNAEDLPMGAIDSKRFFFSPCTSKSITEVPFLQGVQIETLGGNPCSQVEAGEDVVFNTLREADAESALEKAGTGPCALCEQSIPVAMASRDPYRDFRSSMEEMVAAHGLREWSGLHELLHCYLRLNQKETHKFVVLAFVDLLIQLASQGKIHKSVVHDIFSPSPIPSPPDVSPHPH
uniref:Transcription repressor n=1 Tax=Anthurium amnicola TaxID=1678845 RepID=A0A1D1Z2Z5_9ARAE